MRRVGDIWITVHSESDTGGHAWVYYRGKCKSFDVLQNSLRPPDIFGGKKEWDEWIDIRQTGAVNTVSAEHACDAEAADFKADAAARSLGRKSGKTGNMTYFLRGKVGISEQIPISSREQRPAALSTAR
jgi:hypothetical protein